jgi:hypothetical protein
MKRIIDRIRVCIVLHNLLVGSPYPHCWEDCDEEDDADDEEYAEDNDECVVPDGPIVSSNNRQEQIFRYMLEEI